MSILVANVVGARPQFVKLAPVCRALDAAKAQGVANLIVHTGQHYDPAMSDVFFAELRIPHADVHLGIGSGPHGQQTGRMLEKLEVAFLEHRPDIVLTYGDTNSTLAATLAAAKLHVPVAHVEAGLRSFNRRMPEETNRIVADHLGDLLFAPTPTAMSNLANEGLGARAILTGDVMLDAIRFNAGLARDSSRVLERLGLATGRYLVATVHRAEVTDGPDLETLLSALNSLAREDRPVVFPVHPRTAQRIRSALGHWRAAPGLRLIEPLGYLDMIRLVEGAAVVLTDSGGLQKEAFFLARPCVTLRSETEWVETVTAGGNTIAGLDPGAIRAAVEVSLTRKADFTAATERYFGGGEAAQLIVARTLEFLNQR